MDRWPVIGRLIAVPARAWRRARKALSRYRWVRVARSLVQDVPALLVRRPRLALALAKAEAGDVKDRALLDRLGEALRVTRTPALVRRRAQILALVGEPSASLALWRELGARGDRDAAVRATMLAGRLTETDTTWLPRTSDEREPLTPVSRRRILHIAKSSVPERWSGFTIRTLHNLRAQRAAGLDPVVVTDIGWPRDVGVTEVEQVVVYDGIEHHRIDRPAYVASRVPFDQRLRDSVEAMIPIVRQLRPAILHAHSGHRGGEHALVALALRERFGIPVVYEVRGLFEAISMADPGAAERSELYARRLAQETRLLREVNGVLAISDALADEFVERGIPREKITLLPNGIDPDVLDATDRDPALRSRLGLDGRFVAGYLGNLDHWREGMEVLLEALARLHARGRPEFAVLIVGDGSRRAAIEARARELGVADATRFTGRVPHEEVAGYYAQMDVFVNPRVVERAATLITPLKPFEAMALGIPVLVSDLPALREIVDPPHRGITSPPGDADGLADAIARLADDADLRASIAAAGREWVRRERTWASNGPRYRAAYERILGPLL